MRIPLFKMPNYRAPLAIRFENLSTYIKEQIALAVKKDSGPPTRSEPNSRNRVEKLQNASDKLQLWASMIASVRSTEFGLVGDVLEAIDVSESVLSEGLHQIFSEIAAHVSEYAHQAERLKLHTANSLICSSEDPSRWDRDLDKLDDMVPSIRREYADLQRTKISKPPPQSIVLCLGE